MSDGRCAGLGALVIAGGRALHLHRCLDSLAFADEVCVVLDTRSGAADEAAARARGARVVRRAYAGNLEQKRFALTLARRDWTLLLDADEAISAPLSVSLCDFLARAPARVDGAELNRVTRHLGRWLRHGDFHPDWQLRLFRRGAARIEGANPHGHLHVAGAVRRLAGDLEHRSYADLADQLARIQEFSRIEAEALHARGRRFRLRDLALRPPARFARAYVLKRGFLDGVPGFVVAAASGFHVFVKYARLWEVERRRADPAPE